MVKWSNLTLIYTHRVLRVDFFLGFLSLRRSFFTVWFLSSKVFISIHNNNNFVACSVNWGLGILRNHGNGIGQTLRVRLTWKNETTFVFVFCCSYPLGNSQQSLGNSQQLSSSSRSSKATKVTTTTTTWWVSLTFIIFFCCSFVRYVSFTILNIVC